MPKRDADTIAPTDSDDIEDAPSVMLGEIAESVEKLMLADLHPNLSLIELDEFPEPTIHDCIQMSQAVTVPVYDPREPVAVPMVAPSPPAQSCTCRSSGMRAVDGHAAGCPRYRPAGPPPARFDLAPDLPGATADALAALASEIGRQLVGEGSTLMALMALSAGSATADDMTDAAGICGRIATDLGKVVFRLGGLNRAYGQLAKAMGEGSKGA